MSAVGTGTWTAKAGNPSVATITTPTSRTTTITGLTTAGTYSFVWTIASGCTDTADVFVSAKPIAGTDRTGVCQNGTATMAATGTGTWSLLSTNPAVAIITTPTSNTSTVTGLTASGTYGMIWSNANGCTDTANIVVVASPNAGNAGSVNFCSSSSTAMNLANVIWGQQTGGTWTRLTGTGGTFNAGAGTFLPHIDSVNTSTFRYSQPASGGCPATTSIATVVTQECDSNRAVTDYLNWARLDFTPTEPWYNDVATSQSFKSLGNNFTLSTSTIGADNSIAETYLDNSTGYNSLWMFNDNLPSTAGNYHVLTLTLDDGPKRGIQFIVDDFDNGGVPGMVEGAQFIGYLGATPVTPTVTTRSSLINISNAGSYKQALYTGTANESWLAEVSMVNVYFPSLIDKIEIRHFLSGVTNNVALIAGIDIRAIQLPKQVNPDTGAACNYAASTPIANVVANDTINGHLASLGAGVNSAVNYSGIWPAGISLTPSTGAINVAAGVASGAYNLNYKSCDTLTAPYGAKCYIVPFVLNVSAPPNAGADQSISNNSSAFATTGTGTWSAAVGNPAVATIVTPSSPTSAVSGLTTAGTYAFNWNNGICVDQMLIRVSGTSLPVKLVSFNVEKVNETVAKLSWVTAVEIENDRFELERSANGKDWVNIGEVKGAGNSTAKQFYKFTDATPLNGINYYRFKQIDFDGHFEYSDILQETFNNETEVSFTNLFPNPAKGKVSVNVSSQSEQTLQLKIMNIQGQVVIDRNWEVMNGENQIDLDISQLPAGMYTVTLISEKQFNSKKLMVQ